jgi:hypothetical protein
MSPYEKIAQKYFDNPLESAVDNNTVNANEIILTFRNVFTNTLSSNNFNFILTVGL